MPRLLGIRFESVGHPDARLGGLKLRFTKAEGEPCDALLFLRNGGGKSSILNLFFSVLRPGQREFLGKDKQNASRKLDDYVLADDVASVSLEWLLDVPGDDVPSRLFTISCIEPRRVGTGLELQHRFFALRVDPDSASAVTLEGLPLIESEGSVRRLLRPQVLRQRIEELERKHSGVKLIVAERFTEWHSVLESFGLDPEVFKYQLEMNRREGGADALLHFGSHHDFADFFLRMVLRADHADAVRENLARFREELTKRRPLEAEREALGRAAAELEPLAGLAHQRANIREKLEGHVDRCLQLKASLGVALAARRQARAEAESRRGEADQRYREASEQRNKQGWSARVYRRWRAQRLADEASRRHEQAKRHTQQLEHRRQCIAAARYLADLREGAAKIRAVTRELEANLEEHRPLQRALQEAADSLTRALQAELEVRSTRLSLLERELQKVEAQRQESRRQSDVTRGEIGRADAQAQAAEQRLLELEGRRKELERAGLLKVGEVLGEALEQVQTAIVRAQEAFDKAEAAREQARNDERLAGEARSQEQKELTACEQQAAALAAQVQAAEAELAALKGDVLLRRVLEDAPIDLLAQEAEVLRRVGMAIDRYGAQLITLRLQAEASARALDALTRQGLLPTTLDAERVIQALKNAGVGAFAGNLALARSLTDATAADARVRARPELVSGVVVEPAELETARSVLQGLDLKLESPVAVGTTEELLEGGVPGFVVLPLRGLYDLRASEPERQRREAEAVQREADLITLAALVPDLERLRAKLTTQLERTPASWFSTKRAELARAREESERYRQRLATAEERIETAREKEREATLRGRESRKTEATAREAAGRLLAFEREGGGKIEELREHVRELQARAAELRTALTLHEQRQAALDLRRDEMTAGRQSQELERRSVLAEHDAVRRDCSHDVQGGEVELAEARERYTQSKRRFEHAVGATALMERRALLEEDLQRRQAALEKALHRDELTHAEVESVLQESLGSVGLDAMQEGCARLLEEARGAEERALTTAATRAKELETAASDVKSIESRSYVGDVDAEAKSLTLEQIDAAIERADARAARMQEEETAARRLREEMDLRLAELRQEEPQLEGAKKRLEDAEARLPRYAAVEALLAALREGEDLAAISETLREVEECIRSLQEAIRAHESCQRSAEETIRKLGALVRQEEQRDLPPKLRDRLADPDVEVMLLRCPDYLEDVRGRRDLIQVQLNQLEEHRALLAEQLESACDPALRLLKRLERNSVLPSETPVWGGQPFLKVKLRVPERREERRAVTLALLDAALQRAEMPSGIELIQRLVREMTRDGGFEVLVLKPEAHRRLRYLPVPELSQCSGGEKMTAAILLYCTLAAMRAEERGRRQSPSSVLLLDNPLGTANHSALIGLQREMAQLHGVQLIYTTGIEDLEAIGQIPLTIRLRNSHLDARGHQRVTPEAPMEAVRVGRRELQ